MRVRPKSVSAPVLPSNRDTQTGPSLGPEVRVSSYIGRGPRRPARSFFRSSVGPAVPKGSPRLNLPFSSIPFTSVLIRSLWPSTDGPGRRQGTVDVTERVPKPVTNRRTGIGSHRYPRGARVRTLRGLWSENRPRVGPTGEGFR